MDKIRFVIRVLKNLSPVCGWAFIGLGCFCAAMNSGCGEKNMIPPLEKTSYYTKDIGWVYSIVVIDHCQYIQFAHGLAHKGDCTNSIHIYNKPLVTAEWLEENIHPYTDPNQLK